MTITIDHSGMGVLCLILFCVVVFVSWIRANDADKILLAELKAQREIYALCRTFLLSVPKSESSPRKREEQRQHEHPHSEA